MDETPQDKLKRLQNEVNKFEQELSTQTNNNSEPSSVSSSASNNSYTQKTNSALLSDIQSLQSKLSQLESSSSPLNRKFTFNSQNYQILLSQLSSNPQSSSNSNLSENNTQQQHSNSFLSVNPEMLKLGEIEKRITALEKVIGTQGKEDEWIKRTLKNKGLITEISDLDKEVKLLDINKMKSIEARLALLTESLKSAHTDPQSSESNHNNNQGNTVGAAADTKGEGETQEELEKRAEEREKINKIYDTVSRIDQLTVTLPGVVGRLRVLKDVHDETISFAEKMRLLELEQKGLSDSLKNDVEVLMRVETGMKENRDLIEGNVKSLEQRISELLQLVNKQKS